MTYEEFKRYAQQSTTITKDTTSIFKELVQKYPYFHIANWMYLKSLKELGDIHYEKQLNKTSLHTKDRRKLYYYIHNEELITDPRIKGSSGDGSYFDMIQKIDRNKNEENKTNNLKNIAERLKMSRATLQHENKKTTPQQQPKEQPTHEWTIQEIEQKEEQAKAYIKEKSYFEAIKLLEELKNLNNSKKSVYFADQIRFLKKIVEN